MSTHNSTSNHSDKHHSDIQKLSDLELVRRLTKLLGEDQRLEVDLLMHICEADRRKLYRARAYSSLFKFCVEELHLPEAVAYKRITVARAAREYPVLLEAIAKRKVHLTGTCMLVPHLTSANVKELIEKATHKSKRQIEELLANLFPKPDVKSQIRKLPAKSGPVQSKSLSAPTATTSVQSEPCDDFPKEASPSSGLMQTEQVVTSEEIPCPSLSQLVVGQNRSASRRDLVSPLGSSRFKVQFTADATLNAKIGEAQELLGAQIGRGDLAALFSKSLDLLLSDLKNKKHAVTSRPRVQRATVQKETEKAGSDDQKSTTGAGKTKEESGPTGNSVAVTTQPGNERSKSRYIPRAVRRKVYERDDGRCAYVSPDGKRCSERWGLEYHHKLAFGLGGESTADNLILMCRCHNGLAAEQDFGVEKMAQYTKTSTDSVGLDLLPNSCGPSICAEQRADYDVHQTKITPLEFAWPTEQDPDPVILPVLLRETPVFQSAFTTTHPKNRNDGYRTGSGSKDYFGFVPRSSCASNTPPLTPKIETVAIV